MSRRSIITGLLLVLLGGGVFLWKTVALDLPLVPSEPVGLWQVQLEISARGAGRRGSLQACLPSPERVQRIFGEQFETGDAIVFHVQRNGQLIYVPTTAN